MALKSREVLERLTRVKDDSDGVFSFVCKPEEDIGELHDVVVDQMNTGLIHRMVGCAGCVPRDQYLSGRRLAVSPLDLVVNGNFLQIVCVLLERQSVEGPSCACRE